MHHREEALMCTTDRHDGSCPACETDTWIVPSGPTSTNRHRGSPETASHTMPGTQPPPTPRERATGAFVTNRDGGDRA